MYDIAFQALSLVYRFLIVFLDLVIFLASNYVLLVLVIGDIYLSFDHAQRDFPSWQTPLISYGLTVAMLIATGEPIDFLFLNYFLPLTTMCLLAFAVGKFIARKRRSHSAPAALLGFPPSRE